jgi:hypothetical protein
MDSISSGGSLIEVIRSIYQYFMVQKKKNSGRTATKKPFEEQVMIVYLIIQIIFTITRLQFQAECTEWLVTAMKET